MGISSLHTWVEAKRLGKPLTILPADEGSRRRVVVVDVCALMLYLFGPHSLVANFDAMRANVERLVSRWALFGVDIVAVIDGAVPPEKVSTWLARRRKDAKTVAKINAFMRSKTPLAAPGAPRSGRMRPHWLPPAFSQSYLGQAFRAAGCRVVFTTIEADRVAAGIASELGALGVLGHDSDFFVFSLPPGTRYLDVNTLKQSKGALSVMSYEQEDVLRGLGISREAMPLLAADLGFDLVGRSSRLTSQLAAERERRAAGAASGVEVAVVDASGGAEPVAVQAGGAGADAGEESSALLAVELALKRLRTRMLQPDGLEPCAGRERAAVEWYRPAPPLAESAVVVTRPHVEVLLQHRTFVGPLCVEDVTTSAESAGPSVFEATAQLRAAVYKRLFGASQPGVITEFLCSARREQPWDTTTCSFADAAPAMHPRDVVAAAPGVAPAAAIARHVVERWLKPFLTAAQARALIRQADPQKREAARQELRAIRGDSGLITLRCCWPENVHAATLFLVATETFCFGCRGEDFDPPVWKLLVRCIGRAAARPARAHASSPQDGVTFHFMCDPLPFRGRRPSSPRTYVSRDRAERRPAARPPAACLRPRAAPSVARHGRGARCQRPARRAAGFAAARTPCLAFA